MKQLLILIFLIFSSIGHADDSFSDLSKIFDSHSSTLKTYKRGMSKVVQINTIIYESVWRKCYQTENEIYTILKVNQYNQAYYHYTVRRSYSSKCDDDYKLPLYEQYVLLQDLEKIELHRILAKSHYTTDLKLKSFSKNAHDLKVQMSGKDAIWGFDVDTILKIDLARSNFYGASKIDTNKSRFGIKHSKTNTTSEKLIDVDVTKIDLSSIIFCVDSFSGDDRCSEAQDLSYLIK